MVSLLDHIDPYLQKKIGLYSFWIKIKISIENIIEFMKVMIIIVMITINNSETECN